MWLNWPTDGESERGEWKDGEKNEETRKKERERVRGSGSFSNKQLQLSFRLHRTTAHVSSS